MKSPIRCMKMQAVCCLLLVCFGGVSAQTKTEYSISGDVRDVAVSISKVSIYIENISGKIIRDSCEVKNGRYFFKGNIASPSLAFIDARYSPDSRMGRMDDSLKYFEKQEVAGTIRTVPFDFLMRYNSQYNMFTYSVFFGATDMTVVSHGDFCNIRITGAPLNADHEILDNYESDFQKKYLGRLIDSMCFYSRSEDTANFNRLDLERKRISELSLTEVYLKFAQDHLTSPLSVVTLSYVSNNPFNPDLVKPTFDKFSEDLKSSVNGKIFAARIEAFYRTAIGQPAIDFSMKDTAGSVIKLSSFKGNYVLIDFWASWCAPCRRENKTLIKTWERFKQKKFVILGVSLDYENGREKWINAIHEDKLDWFQVSDLNGRAGTAVKLYDVVGIPDNVLIDPSGKIIARNIHGEALADKLQEVFEMPAL